LINKDLLYVKDILNAIQSIEKYTNNLSEESFGKSKEKQQLVLFNLQIIGEASGHISSDTKKKHANVEWNRLKRLRNFIVHEYFNVNYSYAWYTVKNYLPKLKKDIEAIEKEIT